MRRREVVAGLAAATACPLAARAQQPAGFRRIGFLSGHHESDPEARRRLRALRDGLQALGRAEGPNLSVELSLGRGRCRSHPGLCGGADQPEAGPHPHRQHPDAGRIAEGDSNNPHRVRGGVGPDRRRASSTASPILAATSPASATTSSNRAWEVAATPEGVCSRHGARC